MNVLFRTLREKIRANPSGLYVLFYTEMWELFGRFGITALLVLYLTRFFHIPDAQAFLIYSSFIALYFAMPILCGYLADRYLGSRHAIVFGALMMIAGDALMVIPEVHIVIIGLAIVAVGSGFFLPAIPPLVSALYEHDETKRDAGFTLYYLGKNIGALLAPILCGYVGYRFGLNYAFALSTLGMMSGVAIFLLGQKHLRGYNKTARIQGKAARLFGLKAVHSVYLIAAVLVPLVLIVLKYNLDGYLLAITGAVVVIVLVGIFIKRPDSRKNLLAILVSLVALIIFESFLGQGGTTLNLFVQREVDRHLLGVTLPTSFFYSLDPIFMLLMGPILAGIWMRLGKRGREPSVFFKHALGLILLGLGFLVFVVAAVTARHDGSASPLFVVLAYYIFPIAELCIVPISLSLVTKLAPKDLSSVFVGIWMLSNAVSSYFTGQISKFGQVNFNTGSVTGAEHAAIIYHHLFAGTAQTLVISGVVLLLITPLCKRLLQKN